MEKRVMSLILVFVLIFSVSVSAFSLYNWLKDKSASGILEPTLTGKVVQENICSTLEQYYYFGGSLIDQTNTGVYGKQDCQNWCTELGTCRSCWWFGDGGCVCGGGERIYKPDQNSFYGGNCGQVNPTKGVCISYTVQTLSTVPANLCSQGVASNV